MIVLVEEAFSDWFLFRYAKLDLVYYLNQSRHGTSSPTLSGLDEIVNQVKFTIAMSPEQEPVQEFFFSTSMINRLQY